MLKKFLHQANIISCILQVSPDGIANRDEKVFRFARERNIPIVMLTSGPPLSLSVYVEGRVALFTLHPPFILIGLICFSGWESKCQTSRSSRLS